MNITYEKSQTEKIKKAAIFGASCVTSRRWRQQFKPLAWLV
jgi:hypothetical protein